MRGVFRPIVRGIYIAILSGVLCAPAALGAPEAAEHPEQALQSPSASGALSLPQALSLAVRDSPRLAAFAWDLRAGDAKIEQADLRPNPELSVEIEDVRLGSGPSEVTRTTSLSGPLAPTVSWEREKAQGARSGFRESEVTISIAQLVQLGRKRAMSVAAAEREKDLVLWDYQAARASVLAQTASDFVRVLVAQEQVALEAELVSLAEEVLRIFSLRVKAGQVSPLELSRAEITLLTTQLVYEERLGELESARAVLASNWGANRAAFSEAVGQLDATLPVPSLEAIEARLNQNPDLARWSAELAARRAELQVERARRIPDLTVALGFRTTGLADRKTTQFGFGSGGDFGYARSESGFNSDRDNRLVLGFSLPLPLFGRNQGNIAAAEAMIGKVAEERRGVESEVYAELASAHQAASSGYAKAHTLQNEVMPKVEDTFKKIQRGYQQGKFSYLEVLDTQRTLFDAREAQIEALAQYHLGVVRLERLTGIALDEDTTLETSMENVRKTVKDNAK